MKRIFIIVGILIGAVGIVTIGMLLAGGNTPSGPTTTLPPSGTLPIAGNNGTTGTSNPDGTTNPDNTTPGNNLPVSGLETLTQAAIVDYIPGPQGVTYIATNGAVFSPTSTESIAQADFGPVAGAWFSPDGKWLLVKNGSAGLYSWNLLDINKKTWKAIQANTSDMVWSQNGSQLAYIGRRTNGGTLNTYTPASGATKALLNLFAPDLSIVWKDSSHIFLLDKPTSLVSGNIWEFNMTNSNLTAFVTNVSGAGILWGGPKSGGLVFKAGTTGGSISIVASAGNTTQTAGFLTFPSKCAFGEVVVTSTISNISDYLFCGIPQNQQAMREARLPDDYLKGNFGTNDALYAIGLVSGNLKSILPASQSFGFDMTNVKVYGESAYFVNKNDEKLYKASLSAL